MTHLHRGGKRPRWDALSRALAVALTLHEDGLCPGCGHPRARAWNPHAEGHYETARHTCQACAQQDRARADKAAPREPGGHVGVFDADPTAPLPQPRTRHTT